MSPDTTHSRQLTPTQNVLHSAILQGWTEVRGPVLEANLAEKKLLTYGEEVDYVARFAHSRTGLPVGRCQKAAHTLFNKYRHGHCNPHYPEWTI